MQRQCKLRVSWESKIRNIDGTLLLWWEREGGLYWNKERRHGTTVLHYHERGLVCSDGSETLKGLIEDTVVLRPYRETQNKDNIVLHQSSGTWSW